MDILVCVKAVPVTTEVRTDDQFRLQRDNTQLQWNIADESALEAALRLKGATGHVTVLTMGPPKLENQLRELLARGADRVALLTDPKLAGSDTLATARALAVAIGHYGRFDLVLCGMRAIDGETGQVPGMLAAALDIPCITNAESIQQIADGVLIKRTLENTTQTLSVKMPAVVSLCAYSYPLRLPGIMGLRRARQQQIEVLSADALGLTEIGLKGSGTKVRKITTRFPGLRQTEYKDIHQIAKLCKEVAK